jgi:hypothetical protein
LTSATSFALAATLFAGAAWCATPVPPTATPAARFDAASMPSARDLPASAADIDRLRDEIATLSSQVHDLGAAESPPPWAVATQEKLSARVERMIDMEERLAARIETPLPRLDEPIILFTFAGSSLLLGFVIGRSVQRRRDRREGRFRL